MKCELCNADPMTANCNGANCMTNTTSDTPQLVDEGKIWSEIFWTVVLLIVVIAGVVVGLVL